MQPFMWYVGKGIDFGLQFNNLRNKSGWSLKESFQLDSNIGSWCMKLCSGRQFLYYCVVLKYLWIVIYEELGPLSKETFIITNIRLTSDFLSCLSLIKHKGSTGILEILALCWKRGIRTSWLATLQCETFRKSVN